MLILMILVVALIAFFALGYRMVASGSSTKVANGVTLMVVVGGLAAWLLSPPD